MKNFRVTVNGTAYDVQVEETETSTAAPNPAATKQEQPALDEAQKTAALEGAEAPALAPARVTASINAPMKGIVTEVKVSAGNKVSENQVVAIMEALMMEHEITAPSSGVIADIFVQRGDTVEEGSVLMSLS